LHEAWWQSVKGFRSGFKRSRLRDKVAIKGTGCMKTTKQDKSSYEQNASQFKLTQISVHGKRWLSE